MNIYEELGVRTLINAAGTVTRYGGSLMAPEVLDSMRGASQQFCHLDEVQKKVGERIAAMLEVEAAYVTSSAACGLVLTTAACMAGTDPAKIEQLPDTTGMKHEVIIQKIHRIAYDQAIRVAGGTLIEIDDQGTPPTEEMRRAINENTAAIFFMATVMNHPASVPLDEVVAMAKAASVPVVVDAASECPPVSTLTRFWEAGADLIIFSGGKSIMGPQSTGLVIGRKDLIAGCACQRCPIRHRRATDEGESGGNDRVYEGTRTLFGERSRSRYRSMDGSTGLHRSSVTRNSKYNRRTVHQVGDLYDPAAVHPSRSGC